jgi:hypothetical protein
MIFNRHWYERYDGRPELDEYQAAMQKLSVSQRAELLAFLSARHPGQYQRGMTELDRSLRTIAGFYVPISKQSEARIAREQKRRLEGEPKADIRLSSEEIVEDAGLDDDVPLLQLANKLKRTGRAA